MFRQRPNTKIWQYNISEFLNTIIPYINRLPKDLNGVLPILGWLPQYTTFNSGSYLTKVLVDGLKSLLPQPLIEEFLHGVCVPPVDTEGLHNMAIVIE